LGYKQGAPLLLEALKKESREYSACFQAIAIFRLEDLRIKEELDRWVKGPASTKSEKKLKSEVLRALKAPLKWVP
jgi:hypothetical protein